MPEAVAAENDCAREPDSSSVPLAETLGWTVNVPCWRLESATEGSRQKPHPGPIAPRVQPSALDRLGHDMKTAK
jgi:hypothetical protein